MFQSLLELDYYNEAPEGYNLLRIDHVVNLTSWFEGEIRIDITTYKKADRLSLYVPFFRRSSTDPRFVDDVNYVVGNESDPEKARVWARFIKHIATTTKLAPVEILAAHIPKMRSLFMDKNPGKSAIKSTETVAFTYNGKFIHELRPFQEFWIAYLQSKKTLTAKAKNKEGICCLTGIQQPLVKDFQYAVKGLPNGASTGCWLTTAFIPSTHSYNRTDSSSVASLGIATEKKLILNLNYLLGNRDYNFLLGDIKYVCWFESNPDISVTPLFQDLVTLTGQESMALVTKHFKEIIRGGRSKADFSESPYKFKLLGLKANSARAVISEMVELPESVFIQNYKDWLKKQMMPLWKFIDRRSILAGTNQTTTDKDNTGNKNKKQYYSLWALSNGCFPFDSAKEKKNTTDRSFLRNLLLGTPLSNHIPLLLCRKHRDPRAINNCSIVILKMYLASMEEPLSMLQKFQNEIAFCYGRLFYSYCSVESKARSNYRSGNTKVDLYNTNCMKLYTRFSSNPAILKTPINRKNLIYLTQINKSSARGSLGGFFGRLQTEIENRIQELITEAQKQGIETSSLLNFNALSKVHFDAGFHQEKNWKNNPVGDIPF